MGLCHVDPWCLTPWHQPWFVAGPGVVVTQTVNRAYQFYRSAFLYLRRDLLAHNSATIAKTGDDKAKTCSQAHK